MKFLLVLLLLHQVSGQGFRTVMTSAAIEKIRDYLLPTVQSDLNGLSLPDISGSSSTPIGITINYQLSNIVLQQFDFGTCDVTLVAGQGVQLNLPNIYSVLTMDWSYSAILDISGSGTSTDQLTLSFQALVELGETNGEPTIEISGLSVDLVGVTITVTGGDSWFYQVMVDIFKNTITGALQSAITNELNSVLVNLANYYLARTPTTLAINANLTVDYSLTSAPDIESSYSVTNHLGGISMSGVTCTESSSIPIIVSNMPTTFIISTTIGDCILYQYWQAQILDFTIAPSDVPADSPIQLNTSNADIKNTIPQLYALYPNSGIYLDVEAGNEPTTAIVDGYYVGKFLWEVYVEVSYQGQMQDCILLEVSSVVITQPYIDNQYFYLDVKGVNHTTTIGYSNIGTLNAQDVDNLATVLIAFGIVPELKDLTATGVPLPQTDGISLFNTTLLLGTDYFQVDTDFEFSSSKLKEFTKHKLTIV